MRRTLAIFALAAAAAASWAQAPGPSFRPGKPVTLVVPYSAGGGTDAIGRLFALELGELWGQSVVVDNRPGANGTIGSALVARAAPDGHTLLLSVASIAIHPHLGKLPYDTRKDFTPITSLARPVVVMVGAPGLQAGDMRSFIELARQAPGAYSFASSEPGTRLYGELLSAAAGIKLLHVPYKGASQWMADLVGNNVHVGFASLTSALPMVREGRIRILGIAAWQRSELAPQVPTVREQGIHDMETKSWYGLFGPGQLPPTVSAALHADVQKVLARPEVVARLAAMGAEPAGEAPDAFARRFLRELEQYGELVRRLGIQVD